MGKSRPLFLLYLRPFHITIQIKLEKSVDVLLGTRTKACRMDPLSYGGLNYRVNDIGSYSLL